VALDILKAFVRPGSLLCWTHPSCWLWFLASVCNHCQHSISLLCSVAE